MTSLMHLAAAMAACFGGEHSHLWIQLGRLTLLSIPHITGEFYVAELLDGMF